MPSKFTSSLSEQAVIEDGKLKYSPMAGSKHNTRSYVFFHKTKNKTKRRKCCEEVWGNHQECIHTLQNPNPSPYR